MKLSDCSLSALGNSTLCRTSILAFWPRLLHPSERGSGTCWPKPGRGCGPGNEPRIAESPQSSESERRRLPSQKSCRGTGIAGVSPWQTPTFSDNVWTSRAPWSRNLQGKKALRSWFEEKAEYAARSKPCQPARSTPIRLYSDTERPRVPADFPAAAHSICRPIPSWPDESDRAQRGLPRRLLTDSALAARAYHAGRVSYRMWHSRPQDLPVSCWPRTTCTPSSIG